MSYYEYVHQPGYGRDDHMADEIIARAAHRLGCAGAVAYLTAAMGLRSHSVPQGAATVRLAYATGVREMMERAIRAAKREVRSHDCVIYVACRRVRYEGFHEARQRLVEERRGSRWSRVSVDPAPQARPPTRPFTVAMDPWER